MLERLKELLGIRTGYLTWEEFQERLRNAENLRRMLLEENPELKQMFKVRK